MKFHSPRATVGGIAAILLWSTTVAVARSLAEAVGPVSAAAAVYCVSGVAALISLARRGDRGRSVLRLPLSYLLGCGALFVGYMLLLYLAVGWSETRQQVLGVGLLNYLWPTLTVVLSLPVLGHRADWRLLPGTVMALAGLFLVFTRDGPMALASLAENLTASPAPYLLAFLAAVFWALYSVLTRRLAGGRSAGAVGLFLPATAVILLLVSLLFDEPRAWNSRAFLEAGFLGLATYFGYALWDRAMRQGDVTLVAAASYLTPLLSTLVSCWYLAVVPGTGLWVGCALLVAGSLLSWRSVGEGTRRWTGP